LKTFIEGLLVESDCYVYDSTVKAAISSCKEAQWHSG